MALAAAVTHSLTWSVGQGPPGGVYSLPINALTVLVYEARRPLFMLKSNRRRLGRCMRLVSIASVFHGALRKWGVVGRAG